MGGYEGRRPYGKIRRRQKDNMKMDLSEIEWEGRTRLM